LAISLLFSGAILGLIYLLLHDTHRAAILTAISLLLFFSYGQVYGELKDVTVGGELLFRHRTLGILWAVLLVAGSILAWRHLRKPARWTPWLNLVSALLRVFPALSIASTALTRRVQAQASPIQESFSDAIAPDIYFIILDGYGRQDLLRAKFDYDNSEFIRGLEQRGFYVAD
jgi:hypothetical protein